MCLRWRRCWSMRMPRSARKPWTASSIRPKRSTPGICRWPCARTCRPAPFAASVRWWVLPSWSAWQRAMTCRTPPAPDSASPADLVAAAQKDGRLDAGFVEQAAQSGKRDLVIAALAQLANVSEHAVKKILNAGSAKPVIALVWHAHLSMRVAFKIQTGIMKLSGRDLLPARGGIGFPLTKEEMRWHLGYFDISV